MSSGRRHWAEALINPENGGKTFEWSARLERYAQSVDQRVKMPYWMEEFERRGGRLVIQRCGNRRVRTTRKRLRTCITRRW